MNTAALQLKSSCSGRGDFDIRFTWSAKIFPVGVTALEKHTTALPKRISNVLSANKSENGSRTVVAYCCHFTDKETEAEWEFKSKPEVFQKPGIELSFWIARLCFAGKLLVACLFLSYIWYIKGEMHTSHWKNIQTCSHSRWRRSWWKHSSSQTRLESNWICKSGARLKHSLFGQSMYGCAVQHNRCANGVLSVCLLSGWLVKSSTTPTSSSHPLH